MTVVGQNNFSCTPLERFANFHKTARSSQIDLSLLFSVRARRAVSIDTTFVARKRIRLKLRSTQECMRAELIGGFILKPLGDSFDDNARAKRIEPSWLYKQFTDALA